MRRGAPGGRPPSVNPARFPHKAEVVLAPNQNTENNPMQSNLALLAWVYLRE